MFVTKLKGTDVNPQSPPLGAGEFGNDLFLYMDKTNLIFSYVFFPQYFIHVNFVHVTITLNPDLFFLSNLQLDSRA